MTLNTAASPDWDLINREKRNEGKMGHHGQFNEIHWMWLQRFFVTKVS